MTCFSLNIISVIACGFADNIAWFLLARFIMGIGEGGTVAVQAMIRDLFDDVEERAHATNYFVMIQIFAPVIAPSVGGALGTWFGWRMVFLILAFAMIVCLPVFYRYLEETLVTEEGTNSESYWSEVKGFFSTYQVIALLLGPALALSLIQFFLANMPQILEGGFQLTSLQTSLALAIFAFVVIIAGGLSEAMQQKNGIYSNCFVGSYFMLLPMVYAIIVALTLSHSVWAFMGLQVMYNFFFLTFAIATNALYMEPLKESYGFAAAIANTAQLTFGTLIVGVPGESWIASFHGAQKWSSRVEVYSLWFAIVIAVTLAIFWIMFGFNPPEFALAIRDNFIEKVKGEGQEKCNKDEIDPINSEYHALE